MFIEIITPEKYLYKGQVKSIKLPGSTGEFEVLNNHAPIISTLKSGNIRVIDSKEDVENFKINGGVIELQNNKVIILVD